MHFTQNRQEGEAVPLDRLYKVRNIVDLFKTRMPEIYYLGLELSIDESMVLWYGQLSPVYKEQKEQIWHKIIYAHYTWRNSFEFYGLHWHVRRLHRKKTSRKVVLKLLEGFLLVGRSVFMGNYYTSFELAKSLADKTNSLHRNN